MKERLQSEDRCHRAGQTNNVHIIDLVADNTQDTKIIESLRGKFDNASTVIDGKLRDWLLTYDAQTSAATKSEVGTLTNPDVNTGAVVEDVYELFRGL